MSKDHDEKRRAFLIGTAVGAAGAVVVVAAATVFGSCGHEICFAVMSASIVVAALTAAIPAVIAVRMAVMSIVAGNNADSRRSV